MLVDVWQGGLHSLKAGEEPESLKARRAAAKAQSNSGSSIFRSFTSVRGAESTDTQAVRIHRQYTGSTDTQAVKWAGEEGLRRDMSTWPGLLGL